MVFDKCIGKSVSVIECELMTIREGIKIVVERNIQPLLVTSDSSPAVQTVTQIQDYLSYLGTWATEIQQLQSFLIESSIVHIRRSANNVAHSIAKFFFFFPSPFIRENGIFPS